MKEIYVRDTQILTDGGTVWVNTSESGAIGRFSRLGIDVHNPTNTLCRDCGPHTEDPAESWSYFTRKIQEIHGVEIPEDFRPSWLT